MTNTSIRYYLEMGVSEYRYFMEKLVVSVVVRFVSTFMRFLHDVPDLRCEGVVYEMKQQALSFEKKD